MTAIAEMAPPQPPHNPNHIGRIGIGAELSPYSGEIHTPLHLRESEQRIPNLDSIRGPAGAAYQHSIGGPTSRLRQEESMFRPAIAPEVWEQVSAAWKASPESQVQERYVERSAERRTPTYGDPADEIAGSWERIKADWKASPESQVQGPYTENGRDQPGHGTRVDIHSVDTSLDLLRATPIPRRGTVRSRILGTASRSVMPRLRKGVNGPRRSKV